MKNPNQEEGEDESQQNPHQQIFLDDLRRDIEEGFDLEPL